MASLKLSKALRNHVLGKGSWKSAFTGGKILVYTGAPPTNAEDAFTGTLLVTVTDSSNGHTPETLATGTVTLTGGASGSINTVTVNGVNVIPNGAVPFNSSLAQTAADLAAAINSGSSYPEYTATASGAVVTISAMPGSGTTPNTFVVTATLTTITATFANMAGGVAAVNGLRFAFPGTGVIGKDPAQAWYGLGAVNGTPGYFRLTGSILDAQAIDTTETFIRLQGDIGASGVMSPVSPTIAIGMICPVNSFTITAPAS